MVQQECFVKESCIFKVQEIDILMDTLCGMIFLRSK